jgi:hypothetical protein
VAYLDRHPTDPPGKTAQRVGLADHAVEQIVGEDAAPPVRIDLGGGVAQRCAGNRVGILSDYRQGFGAMNASREMLLRNTARSRLHIHLGAGGWRNRR